MNDKSKTRLRPGRATAGKSAKSAGRATAGNPVTNSGRAAAGKPAKNPERVAADIVAKDPPWAATGEIAGKPERAAAGKPGKPGKKTAKAPSRHKSNRAWIERHISDPYVQAATRHGYRSRAAYKLLEIDDRDRLLRPGSVVVDLGAAPGSWSQVVAERLGAPAARQGGRIVALDLLPMDPIAGVQVLIGDFREDEVAQQLAEALEGRAADLILSDMAPNLSGIGVADAARSAHLWDLALEFALRHLKPEGRLLVKTFQGSGYSQFVEQLKRHFAKVQVRKPAASRQESAETYLLASGLKPRAG
jgi:23S rRNA (uridine2552-2'-O)-methyltransferase